MNVLFRASKKNRLFLGYKNDQHFYENMTTSPRKTCVSISKLSPRFLPQNPILFMKWKMRAPSMETEIKKQISPRYDSMKPAVLLSKVVPYIQI